MSLVYIGCGLDFAPLEHFTKIKRFIYIDSLPKSSNGYSGFISSKFSRKNYCDDFRRNIPKEFVKVNINHTYPDVFMNHFTGQTLLLYYNLPFPWGQQIYQHSISKKDIDLLIHYIGESTHLMVCGFDPHVDVLTLLPKEFILVVKNRDETGKKTLDYPSLCSELVLQPIYQQRFKEVVLLSDGNVITMPNYAHFLKFLTMKKTSLSY